MQTKIFNVSIHDVISAVVSGVLVSILGYLSNVTDIASISIHQILSIAALTAVTSLLKAFVTDSNGQVLGAIKIR